MDLWVQGHLRQHQRQPPFQGSQNANLYQATKENSIFLLQALLHLLAHKSEHLNEGNFLPGSVSLPFSHSLKQTHGISYKIFFFLYHSLHFLCFPILNLKDYLCWELFSDVDFWDLCKKGQSYWCTCLFGKAAVILKRQAGDTHIKAAFVWQV